MIKICIAGKNNIAVYALQHLLQYYFHRNEILVIPNTTDTGIDTWQKSVYKFAKDKELQIVCGAFNAKKDLICVCALPYAFMPSGKQIIPGKLLGIDSNGMLCSGRELSLDGYENKRGLLELDDTYKVGSDFFAY